MEYPVERLAAELRDFYQATCVGWSFRTTDGGGSCTTWPAGIAPGAPDAAGSWVIRPAYRLHPLNRWYWAASNSAAQSVGVVPEDVVSPCAWAIWEEVTGPFGMNQLIIPLDLCDAPLRSFVVARRDADFDPAEIATARRLQPLLLGLERQVRTAESIRGSGVSAAYATGLTPRELTVLQLMAEGLTAAAIAHRLSLSPRTVHKHLEHVYSKLGVRDRLTAVLHAERAGILVPRTA